MELLPAKSQSTRAESKRESHLQPTDPLQAEPTWDPAVPSIFEHIILND